jgi:hypothetical protein
VLEFFDVVPADETNILKVTNFAEAAISLENSPKFVRLKEKKRYHGCNK